MVSGSASTSTKTASMLVDGVIPILQQRGLYKTEYAGSTLREHLGVPAQYGVESAHRRVKRPRLPRHT